MTKGGNSYGLRQSLQLVKQVNIQISAGVRPGGCVPGVLKISGRAGAPGVWISVSGN